MEVSTNPTAPASATYSPSSRSDRTKHIQLRLTISERDSYVSSRPSYTHGYADRVDILSSSSTRPKRAPSHIREPFSILSGTSKSWDVAGNEGWFANVVFEIGRTTQDYESGMLVAMKDYCAECKGELNCAVVDAESG
jgi:hypothetical protein